MERATRRRYVDHALVLETEWETPDGLARVTDFMPPPLGAPRSRSASSRACAARSRWRWTSPSASTTADSCPGRARWAAITASSPVPTRSRCAPTCRSRGEGLASVAEFTVKKGEFVSFVLSWNPSWQHPHEPPHAGAALEATLEWWRGWAGRLRYDGAWKDDVLPVADGAQGAHLRADRRHRRRPDDLAARAHRRRAQLGLPLLLAARRGLHAVGAQHRRLHRRGAVVAQLAAARGGRRSGQPAGALRA